MVDLWPTTPPPPPISGGPPACRPIDAPPLLPPWPWPIRPGWCGFGDDPVFLVPELGLTFAELDKASKGRVGHRGRAFTLLEPGLRKLLGAG